MFDVCNFSAIKDWIADGHGEEGIKFQESFGTAEKKCDISELNCYEYELKNPSGAFDKYYNITYFTTRTNNDWKTARNYDFLMLNIGNTGWISRNAVYYQGKIQSNITLWLCYVYGFY